MTSFIWVFLNFSLKGNITFFWIFGRFSFNALRTYVLLLKVIQVYPCTLRSQES